MNKMLTAAAVSAVTAWAVGYSAMASADVTVYGRVVAGAVYNDPDVDGVDGAWDLGATDIDGSNAPHSRFGFKGETDLGNGLTAGFKIERQIQGGSAASDAEGAVITRQRHNLIYLSGGFGKVTLGNQGNPYMSARKWDQTNLYGGAKGYGSGYRAEGISYSMNTGGFSLDVLATGNNATDNDVARTDGEADDPLVAGDNSGNADSGVDGWVLRAGYDFGAVNLDVATQAGEEDNAKARDNTAIGVNGAAGPVDWYLAYQTSELSNGPATAAAPDVDSIGGFVGFNVSESDVLYAYYVSHDEDQAMKTKTETIVGYSRQIGPGVKFIAEYQEVDNDNNGANGDNPSNLGLVVKMDF